MNTTQMIESGIYEFKQNAGQIFRFIFSLIPFVLQVIFFLFLQYQNEYANDKC